MAATQHDNNMSATQHGSSTKHGTKLLDTDNSTKGKKVETTIYQAEQPQLSVGVSMLESLNEEIEIQLFSLKK